MTAPRRALVGSFVAALLSTLIACGGPGPETSSAVQAAPGDEQTGDFVQRDPAFAGNYITNTGTNDRGARFTYAGEMDATYRTRADFNGDIARLTAGLPALPNGGTYRIVSTHANEAGANLFVDPQAINTNDVVIYNACNAATGQWAADQSTRLGVRVYAVTGTVAEGRTSGSWYLYAPGRERERATPQGTNYQSAADPSGDNFGGTAPSGDSESSESPESEKVGDSDVPPPSDQTAGDEQEAA